MISKCLSLKTDVCVLRFFFSPHYKLNLYCLLTRQFYSMLGSSFMIHFWGGGGGGGNKATYVRIYTYTCTCIRTQMH